MSKLSEVEQWELDIERPIPLKDETKCKFLKTKAVIAGIDYHDNESEIEIMGTNGNGLSFRFKTSEERTIETIVECDLGHKHRALKKEDYHYHSFTISKKEAKQLIQWLREYTR